MTVPVPVPSESLGLSLQLSPLNSTQNIWHILSIPSPLSPAHLAGLLAHSDYILGSPSGTLHGESALGELVEDHLNRSLILWVYNSEFDVVREVELIPRRGWGGEGALGAVLGFGALHRLPIGLGEEVQAPGENLFDAGQDGRKSSEYMYNDIGGDSSHFIVPAEMNVPPAKVAAVRPLSNSNLPPPRMMSPDTPPPATVAVSGAGRHGRKTRPHAVASPNRAFDDMFEEGAKRSKEEDFVPSRKGTPLSPPPKPTAPPRATSPIVITETDIGEPGEAEEG